MMYNKWEYVNRLKADLHDTKEGEPTRILMLF